MKYKTIVFETCGYTEVIRDGERHRITFGVTLTKIQCFSQSFS